MKLNEKKSKILFCNNRRKDSYLRYKLNGKDIEQVDVIKLIGHPVPGVSHRLRSQPGANFGWGHLILTKFWE